MTSPTGDGVIVYRKKDNSESSNKIKKFTTTMQIPVTFSDWTDMCDLAIGLASINPRGNDPDQGKYVQDDFYMANNIIMRNHDIETLTTYRQGNLDVMFINATDQDLFALGENWSNDTDE